MSTRTIASVDRGGGGPARRGRAAGRGFTLTELLVVIIIIAVIAAIAIPSFSSMMASSEAALAETRLVAVLRAGRDAAVRSSGDADTGLVFFYEPKGRLTIVACQRVGVLKDKTFRAGGNGTGVEMHREVFIPVDFMEPVQMPRGWMIRGWAPPGTLDNDDANADETPREGWYERGPSPDGRRYTNEGDWVFPETGFYTGNTEATLADAQANTSGANRQTFMIRFEAGTGRMTTGSPDPVLVVAPRPTAMGRGNPPPFGGFRIDRAEDLRRFVRRVLTDPMVEDDGVTRITNTGQREQFRQKLLGDESSDTVLARPVTQVALYDEAALVRDLGGHPSVRGVRLDRETESLYRGGVLYPDLVRPTSGSVEDLGRAITQWIEGDTNFALPYADRASGDAPQARIFTIDRYSGEARRVEVEQ